MKISLLTVLMTLAFLSDSIAQNIRWNSSPEIGFVFQITNDEAQKLLTKSLRDTIIHSLLHTEIDTFNIKKGWTRRPAKGHFILARIRENKLHCEYTSVFPYQVMLLQEYNALSLQVLDLEGNVRTDAKVKLKSRRVRIDPDSKTYRLDNEWFNGQEKIATVELEGFRSVFNIEKTEAPSWSNDYYHDDDEGPDFYSYLITDKNKYKPGERVRFKSYALSNSRTPLRKDLQVWLLKPGRPMNLGIVTPHRPGSFASEFLLHDSLKLTLDQSYTLQLRDKGGRIVSSAYFRYEEYELNGNKLEVKIENDKQYAPASNAIKISVMSENGLMLKDARAKVIVLTENIRETFQPLIVLPDTLMVKELDLDADGPTVVEVPSSLFQKSNTSYVAQVVVLNAQNQRLESSVRGSHYYSQHELVARYAGDTIVYEAMRNGAPMRNVAVKLFKDDAQQGTDVLLPYREKINPAWRSIKIQGDDISRTIRLQDMLPKIQIAGGIQKDSFNITVDNPQQVALSWYVYRGSELLEKGFGTDVEFKSKIEDRTQSYYVELLYAFGGIDHVLSRTFRFREASLDITLSLPDRVYPGQKVDALIEVTDEAGTPLSGVDLTALATTAKLNYNPRSLPYYGGSSDDRSAPATFRKRDVNKYSSILPLDYNRWAKRVRLDTMNYYQFTYPGKYYFTHTEPINDNTQFAAYVMKNGAALPIYVIEVDRVPVYYSWTTHPKAYSFYVAPNVKKQVTLRLHDRVLILDSLCFDADKKTIISLDLDRLPAKIQVHEIKPFVIQKTKRLKRIQHVFTQTEIDRHTPYLAAFQETGYISHLERAGQFMPIDARKVTGRSIIAGPFPSGMATYNAQNHSPITYNHKGGFLYSFEDNIVYKTNPPQLIPYPLVNVPYNPMTTVNDLVITKEMFLRGDIYKPEKWHPRTIDISDYTLRAKFLLPQEKAQSGVASLLFEDLKTKEVVTPCKSHTYRTEYFIIPRGTYNVIVLYNNGTYLRTNDVNFRSHTSLVADMSTTTLNPADSVSSSWLSFIDKNCFRPTVAAPRTLTLVQATNYVGNVRGSVITSTNEPVPGASVVVKGTTIGTSTDIEGNFSLDIPADPSVLAISFIGYVTREIEVQSGSQISIIMEEDVTQLNEVVVVGFGTQRRSELNSSVMVLQGKVAGVSISDEDENESAENAARSSEDAAEEAEAKLYQELLSLKNIRSAFSDVGIWEPKLFTDRHGKSKFTVTFPDDITRWDAVVYGMNSRLQTGTVRKSIKSYKPLMAELHLPQFLTVGDSAEFLGKVLNYTGDKTIEGKTKWSGQTAAEHPVSFNGYHTENLTVVATNTDSLKTSFSFTRNDGYFDGEERKIPVIAQGTIIANGTVQVLNNGETLKLQATDATMRKVEIFDNAIDIYAGDVRYLLNYKYACNEQLASKLIGLLNHKLLMKYEGKPFHYDKDVNKIIQRLLKNQNEEFLWSWWDLSPNTSYWMSAHILRALKLAKDAGYTVNLDLNNVVRKATYKYNYLSKVSVADIPVIHALSMWNAKINYHELITDLDKQIRKEDSVARAHRKKRFYFYDHSLLNEKLLLMEVRQLQKMPFVTDSLLKYKKETILREVYFSDNVPVRYWYSGELPNNAIAYRIVSRDSTLRKFITPMQMYFISLRRKGDWNTYESSNVLMSILPDLLAQGSTKKNPATVSLAGQVNSQIHTFPFKTDLRPGEELSIKKESGLPLYCMQYTEERVTKAQASTDGFKISTAFSDKTLSAGKPSTLRVTIEVKNDAKLEHVMIEIPIPGGCSYADKRHPNNSIETHREYFKDRTAIFCENMSPGNYVFDVELLPRFTGKYHVNPAQVSLMYIPVVNANTDMMKVKIK